MVRQVDISDSSINVTDEETGDSLQNIENNGSNSNVVSNGTHELTNGHNGGKPNGSDQTQEGLATDQQDAMESGECGAGGSSEMVLHDTAGWRALESYMACLEHVMDAMAQSINISESDG